MIDYETRTQQRETIARQKERLEAARNLVDSLKDEKPEASYEVIIAKAASLLKLDQKTVIELQEAYNTKQTVIDMIDYEARTQQRVDEAKFEMAKTLVDSLKAKNPKSSYSSIITEIASLSNLDDRLKQKLQKLY